MENKEELQSLIDELRGQLPSNVTIELADFDEQTEQRTEPQSKPGEALPDWLAELILEGANDIMAALERGEVPASTIISDLDDSDEAAEAMEAVLDRVMMSHCYHYILDERGKPVLCEDDEGVARFEECKGHILARKSYIYHSKTFTVVTCLVVHNPTIDEEAPLPQWLTACYVAETGERCAHAFASSAHEAMKMHRDACRAVRWNILRLQHLNCQHCPSRHFSRLARSRRPSPIRRAKAAKRIAAGRDVLRRKPRKESPERFFQRTLKEAFGDMSGPEIAQALGLPSLPLRKRGQQWTH